VVSFDATPQGPPFGFEVYDCSTAIWCVQTKAQADHAPGDCGVSGYSASSCVAPSTCADSTAKCATSSTLYILNRNCYQGCLPKAGQDSNAKVKACDVMCDSSCKECSGTTTTCTSCPDGKYLYGTTCINDCPSNTLKDTVKMKCTDCASSCAECSETTSKCTSCHNADYLYGSTCAGSCPPSITITNTKTCDACVSPCKECVGTTGSCTSCIDNFYLDGSTCVENCPAGKVKDPSTMTCKTCESPCKECTETISTCTSCIADHYLYESTCVDPCPSGTRANQGKMTCDLVLEKSKDFCLAFFTNIFFL